MIGTALLLTCAQSVADNSLRLDVPGELRLFGKINADWAVIDADDGLEAATGEFGNGARLRRARIGLIGSVQDGVDLKFSADLAAAEIRDAYFDVHLLPGDGFWRLGHFREPLGMTNQTPSHWLTFIERPLSSSLFPSRNLGIAWRREWEQELATVTVGVFRETDDSGDSLDDGGGNEMALSGRWTWVPWKTDADQQMLHVGSSFSVRNPDNGMIAFDGDPGTVIGPSLLDTGAIAADQVLLLGAEAAWKQGANLLSGEVEYARIEQSGDSPSMFGWYLQASHFLSGEQRKYKLSRPTFAPPNPGHPVLYERNAEGGSNGGGSGWGAWELGLRLSQLDLNDQSVSGGEARNIGVALNWYLTAHLRLQTNLYRVTRDGDGDANVFVMRFHLDF